jgi:hypothetical protein
MAPSTKHVSFDLSLSSAENTAMDDVQTPKVVPNTDVVTENACSNKKPYTSYVHDYKTYLPSGEPPIITIMTSFVFMTNCFFAYQKAYYIYSGAFLFLVITSLLLRFNPSKYTLVLDKTTILLILFYGLHMLYQKINVISTIYFTHSILTIVVVVILYHYGYKNECLCFDKDECIAENYMAFVHIISSFAFNIVIFA